MAKDKLTHWAFWKYDQYPFVLSGKVVEFEEGGKIVKVEGYQSNRFQPIFLAVNEHGEQLHKAVRALAAAYREHMQMAGNAAKKIGRQKLSDLGLHVPMDTTGMHMYTYEELFQSRLKHASK